MTIQNKRIHCRRYDTISSINNHDSSGKVTDKKIQLYQTPKILEDSYVWHRQMRKINFRIRSQSVSITQLRTEIRYVDFVVFRNSFHSDWQNCYLVKINCL